MGIRGYDSWLLSGPGGSDDAPPVHCNTGIGVEATRDFVRETCRTLRCPLIEYKATENVDGNGRSDPQIYERMVLDFGFPGPTKFGHGKTNALFSVTAARPDRLS